MECKWCNRPSTDGKWCTQIYQLRSEKKDLELEVIHLKEQLEMWQDNFCKMAGIRDRLIYERDNKPL